MSWHKLRPLIGHCHLVLASDWLMQINLARWDHREKGPWPSSDSAALQWWPPNRISRPGSLDHWLLVATNDGDQVIFVSNWFFLGHPRIQMTPSFALKLQSTLIQEDVEHVEIRSEPPILLRRKSLFETWINKPLGGSKLKFIPTLLFMGLWNSWKDEQLSMKCSRYSSS